MKRLALLVAAIALCATHALPVAATSPTIGDAGAAAIRTYLKAAVDRGDIPGAVALVTNRDRILFEDAVGVQNEAKQIAMRTDTIFNIASMTKPVTSVAIMQLVEQGKLRLDDEAGKYLPALNTLPVLTKVDAAAGTFATRPARSAMTIRQLMTHTSGIGYSFSDPAL